MRTLYGMHLDVPGIPRPGGPSFNKAFFLLEGWLPPHLRRANLAGGRTRPVLRKYWKEYRDVAHLAAAWDYFTERSTNFPIIRDTVGFLSVAQVYQEFGLSFVPLGNEDPLLDSKMVWRVPAGTPRISGALVLDTLSSEATDRLKTYRAPISLV